MKVTYIADVTISLPVKVVVEVDLDEEKSTDAQIAEAAKKRIDSNMIISPCRDHERVGLVVCIDVDNFTSI